MQLQLRKRAHDCCCRRVVRFDTERCNTALFGINTALCFGLINTEPLLMELCTSITSQSPLKLFCLAKIGHRYACQSLWGHGKKVCIKF